VPYSKVFIVRIYSSIMSQYLSHLRQHTENAIREFSAHPIRYTSSAIRDFVKDYWDLGTTALAGFAFNDYHNEILGSAREPVMLLGLFSAFNGRIGDVDRRARNLLGGFATISAFWTRGIDAPTSTEMGNYVAATFLATGSLFMDYYRRRAKSAENSQPVHQSLDAVVK